MAISIIRFLNIILVALLAGTSFGIWAGFNPMQYSASTYIEQQQHLVKSLNNLMVGLVIAGTLVTIASAYIQRQNKDVFFALLLAAVFLISCIFITLFGNLPIQKQMLNWNATSLPENWTILRDKWWGFHVLRTIVELIALAIVAWLSSQREFTRQRN